jgi:Family of unknown function (DUF6172)
MKKTYLLKVDGKNRDRLLDASKHDIRKYIKRERSKPLPVGADFWDFDCRSGSAEDTAAHVHLAELFSSIDALVGESEQFYVELVARPAQRSARPEAEIGPDCELQDLM